MKPTIPTTLAALIGVSLCAQADAAGRVAVRGAHANPSGGVTAGSAVGYRGPNGTEVRGRRVSTDAAGDVTRARGSAATGANGGHYRRGGSTTYNADGSIQHKSGFNAVGPNGGNAHSSGQVTRNADGTYSGSRSTQANGADGGHYDASTQYANGSGTHTTNATGANGNTYEGETSWTRGEGVTHAGTCRDSAGNVIGCH